jgi:hypothetical protein
MVEQDRGQMPWRMPIACWITKGTDIHSAYAMLIDFPRQKWLSESASMLRNAYVTFLVRKYFPGIWKKRMKLAKSKAAFREGIQTCTMWSTVAAVTLSTPGWKWTLLVTRIDRDGYMKSSKGIRLIQVESDVRKARRSWRIRGQSWFIKR